jgi:hypothetical protein
VAIETSRGLLVACLRTDGRQVFAINPLAVARYRERHSVVRKKSDRADARGCPRFRGTSVAAPVMVRPLRPPPDPRMRM